MRISPALARAENLSRYETVNLGDHDFYVADTAEQRKSGLAGLAALDKAGMVFVYDSDVTLAYTMTNMEFDLDIAFYDAEGALIASKTAPAGSGAVISPKPYRYVVESPAGTVDLESLDLSVWQKKGKKKKKS